MAPVSGLALSSEIGEEITINRITFVSRKKLPRIRKRLGFPVTIGELFRKKGVTFINFFNESKTFAVCQLGGLGSEKEMEFMRLVRDELNILSLSQLGYGRRKSNANLSLANEKRPGQLSFFMMFTRDKAWWMSHSISGRYRELVLHSRWKSFQKACFFYTLLDLIQGKFAVSDGWRKDIANAALFAGQSQSSDELPHAFLWNVIAIETLLTHRGDSITTLLPERAEAFIGWTVNWTVSNFHEKIEEIYRKRCELVHAGRINDLKIEDLLFTDTLLLNIFHNILRHINLFHDKNALRVFSKKVQAEKILGVTPKVRPKTLSFLNPRYSDKDVQDL